MAGRLLLAAALIWAAGAGADLAFGTRRARGVVFLAGAAGSVLAAAGGALQVTGRPITFHLGGVLGVPGAGVRIDALSGGFLVLTGSLGACVSACAIVWSRPPERLGGRGAGAGFLLALLATTGVLVAADAFSFLASWEALTVAFLVLVGRGGRARPTWAVLGQGGLSGACLLGGFLLVAAPAHSLILTAWSALPAGAARQGALALVMVAMATKMGLAPLHLWLPSAYRSTEGPLRAALAGVAVNVGAYGLYRLAGVLGPPPVWLAVAALLAGGASALYGSVGAALQDSLNKALSYSAVQGAGSVLSGFGVALAGDALHLPALSALGLLATALATLAHAVAKVPAFCASALFESSAGTDELERLPGVARRQPLAASAFGLACVSLAGLPPTIGFLSEWFLLEALLQAFRLPQLALRLAMAVTGALVALALGVAALSFARLLGLVVLAPGRARQGTQRAGGWAWAGLGLPALACWALAATAPWVIRFLDACLSPLVAPTVSAGALKAAWVLQPVFPAFSSISSSWLSVTLAVALAISATLVAAATRLAGGARQVPAWRSATAGVGGAASYSAWGYSNLLRQVLASGLGLRRPPSPTAHGSRPASRRPTGDPVSAYIWRPMATGWLRLASLAKRLQSGRLDAYVVYMLVALVAVLVAVAATA